MIRFLILILLAQNYLFAESRWSMQTLLKTISYHDGPNCFNAALVAKGMLNNITYVDAIEYRYFLETQCQQTEEGVPGGLFSISTAGSLIHGGILINADSIFEKYSYAGFLGWSSKVQYPNPYLIDEASYKIRPITESRYFLDCDANCEVKKYSCVLQSASQRCSMVLIDSGINEIRELLERIYLDQNQQITFNDKLPSLMHKLNSFLAAPQVAEDICILRLLVATYSTIGSIWHYLNELGIYSGQARDDLVIMKNLADKIKVDLSGRAQSGSPTSRVLEETFQIPL